MNILIPRMELEHKNEPIKCYASILPLVLEFVGFSCIRWSERLIPLFSEYISYKESILATVKVGCKPLLFIIYINEMYFLIICY